MSRGEGAHQRGATILIAEDNPVQAFELTTILSDHGYRVLAAKNGLEALAFARNDLPDLIVSDIIMPGMDGYDLCESLKSDPRTEEIPVILVTSLSNPHDVFRGLNAGADNFIVKPYREEALLDQTEYLLANRRVRRMGRSEVGIEIELGGQRQFITAARQQILDLLISTYEQAVRLYSDLDLRQQELTKSYNTLNALYDIANGLNLCRSEFEVAQSAVERGGRLPGVQAAWFYIKGGDGFRLGAASGAPPALFVDGEEEDCPCQRGMREGTLGLTATMTECRRLPRSEASGELRYHACVPLNANGEAIGILNLVGAERKMFSSDELRTLSAVGSQIAVAYERARTREELERRVEERTAQLRDEVEAHKRAEERLRLMGAVFENSREAFLVTDADHRTVLVNRAFARLTGYASAEMIGRVPDFLAADPDSVRVTMSRLETVAATGFWQGESLGRRKDGSLFPRWLLLSSIRDEAGEVAYHISAFSDVSDIKTKEERLLLLASVFENAAEAIKVFDADMRIVAVNPAFTALTGYSREEVIGRSALILSPSGQADPVVEEAIAIAGATGLWQGETRARRKDGELFPRWLTLSIIRGEAGAVLFHVASFLDITQQKHSQEEIYRLAHHDGLTGLPNRLNLEARLDQALAAANRAGHKVAVLLLDMDRFKTINDTLGHAIGDRLLVELGHRLEGSVRETDIVARHGGDEFIVALTDLVTPGQVATIIEKINQELARPYALDEHQLYSTISIGVSIYPDDGSSLAELLKNAESAMYNAKSDGRNTFRFFTASMNKDAGERLALESGMRLAVERGEFLLHYQPQIEVASGEVLGFEALMRWQRPGQGMVSPGKFIPIAEETGLIVELGTFALREGLRQLRDWRDAGHQGGRVAINLSAHQLRDHAFPDLVRETLAAYRLEPGALELEITESVAMKDPQSTIALLNQLRDNGIELAIDDFGTGYSSMAYLKLLPIQRLKLDQSFVRDIETDPNDAAICTATIALAHSLGLEVVAEGVETEGQYQYLRRLGCNIVQGYFFGRPMPPDQAGPLLGKRVAGS